MRYLFSKCEKSINGGLYISSWAVERWQRQISADYKDLSEEEKESDRTEAEKVLDLIMKLYNEQKW